MSTWGSNPKFDFHTPGVAPLGIGAQGCTRLKNCPSDSAHQTGCLGLRIQLVGIKARRQAFEANSRRDR